MITLTCATYPSFSIWQIQLTRFWNLQIFAAFVTTDHLAGICVSFFIRWKAHPLFAIYFQNMSAQIDFSRSSEICNLFCQIARLHINSSFTTVCSADFSACCGLLRKKHSIHRYTGLYQYNLSISWKEKWVLNETFLEESLLFFVYHWNWIYDIHWVALE